MARGMAIPFQTNRRGGALLREGSTYLRQVIMTGLTPATSKNPFQRGLGIDIGLDERVIFSTNNAVGEALGRRGIIRFFTRLRSSGLARLVPGEPILFTRDGGDLTAEVNYFDLEADREEQVTADLSSGLRSSAKPRIPGSNL